MPHRTKFIVVPFVRGEDGKLVPFDREVHTSQETAKSRAEALVGNKCGTTTIVGTVAIVRTTDPDLPNYSAIGLLVRCGEVPEGLSAIEGQ